MKKYTKSQRCKEKDKHNIKKRRLEEKEKKI